MAPRRKRSRPVRHRVGRVSYYLHHGSWWVYYREDGRPVRERIAECESDAERIAAQINAQLASRTPTLLAFTPIPVAELRDAFLSHHENVLRSSVSTIRRYRAATQFICHIEAAWPEYNRLYAHPFEWTWTNQKMRKWYADHAN